MSRTLQNKMGLFYSHVEWESFDPTDYSKCKVKYGFTKPSQDELDKITDSQIQDKIKQYQIRADRKTAFTEYLSVFVEMKSFNDNKIKSDIITIVENWRQEWLDAPQTKNIPILPDEIKNL